MKKELAVAALQSGTVIDHVPSASLFKAVRILNLEQAETPVTIGNNLPGRQGSKGIIKIAGVEFPEHVLNRIALIAPDATVNIIRNYEVVEKRRVSLPDPIVGLVKCSNPKCITNNEPMKTRFDVIDRCQGKICCSYCGQGVNANEAHILD